MDIKNKVMLVTGANRGIGRALVAEALKRGAKKIYAGHRGPMNHPDKRVIPIMLDVTNISQIKDAVAMIEDLDVLINNAGIALYDDLSDSSMLDKHLSVNLYGPFNVIQAFLPALKKSHGAIVNNLSMVALAPFAPIASYSVSKAAAFSMTQSMRAYLAGQNISVHAIMTGPIDTDMNRGLDIPKTDPEIAAKNIFEGLEAGQEEIFPDPMSAQLADGWNNGGIKAMERQNAMAVQN
ncbi:MAG: SDR family NAD(P)-dependent oxidoreductase [Bacteroidota bacterium]